ncbi:MAG: hypothetical protein GQ468_05370 [Candidatus Scalindua sp.]|nr:hypothetical protein [Candidatus Scalindua sp.]
MSEKNTKKSGLEEVTLKGPVKLCDVVYKKGDKVKVSLRHKFKLAKLELI